MTRSPRQQDGYLADSEENADLSSLQARSEARKNQRKKEEVKEMTRKESKGRREIGKTRRYGKTGR